MTDEIVKHTPSAAETIDPLSQGASLFLDPTGAQVGEQVQGEEGIAYGDLNLNACVEPKQFQDVVGYYQRFDIFDLKVNRRRLGPQTTFQTEVGSVADEPVVATNGLREQSETSSRRLEQKHGMGGLKVL